MNLVEKHRKISQQKFDFRIDSLTRFIYRKFSKKSGKLLDVGVGNGLMMKFFKNKGFQVTGIEISKDLHRVLKKDDELKNDKIILGDMLKIKGSGEYDYVIACDVIEHIKNDSQAVKTLLSHLGKEGKLILSVPAHSFFYGKRDKLLGHYRRYDKSKLVNLIEQNGGKIEDITYWNFLGFFVYYFFEKILKKPVWDKFRSEKKFHHKVIAIIIRSFLKLEELLGYSPIGLTLVAVINKQSEKKFP